VADVDIAAGTTSLRIPREGLVLFWGIQALAFGSVLLPPGPQRPGWYLAALGFAGFVAVLWLATPWPRVPRWLRVVPLLFATAGIACLMHAATTSTGLGTLLLLPLLFSAFYGEQWETWVVIPAIGLAQGLIGLSNHDDALVLTRVLVFYVALLVMIGLAAHALRARLQSTVSAAEEEARQSAVVAAATSALSAPLDPELVIGTATRLAAELVSPAGRSDRRGQYFKVNGDTVTVVAETDEIGMAAGSLDVPVDEHPLIRALLENGEAVNGPIDRSKCGPEVQANLAEFGITHGAYVPVRVGGQITGILNASGRGAPIQPGLFARLQLLASITELALENSSAHQLLEEQALTDPLTKLANRRELERAFARLPDRLPFAFVAVDLDDLKGINDRNGHRVGDDVIVAVAEAISSVARKGDTVARVGGDEFSVLMIDATVEAVEQLGMRIHEAVSHVRMPGGSPTLSIGGCIASPGSDTGLVQGTADSALYEAKHRGGSCTVTKIFELVEHALIA
jgi:diguanylate cyclase (GGDEF)-like protein